MKVISVLTALVLAVATTNAEDCSLGSISAVQEKPEFQKLKDACGPAVASFTASIEDEGAAKKLCQDKTCMGQLEVAIKVLPECTVSGNTTFKKAFEDKYEEMKTACKSIQGSSSASVLSTTAALTVTAVAMFAQL